jgi:hypothetical protein
MSLGDMVDGLLRRRNIACCCSKKVSVVVTFRFEGKLTQPIVDYRSRKTELIVCNSEKNINVDNEHLKVKSCIRRTVVALERTVVSNQLVINV